MAQLIPLTHLGLVRISGDDTLTFLQGQLTINLMTLEENQWSWGGHCDPKGKLLASFRVLKQGGDILMLMPKELISLDMPQLQKYAVFNKVTITDASDELPVHGLLGDDACQLAAELFAGDGNLRHLESASLLLDDASAILLGEVPGGLSALESGSEAQWLRHEIAQAWPMLPASQSGELVPQMLNLDAVGGIQYDKGCYIGQETVARMHFRGGNKRATFVLKGSASALPEGDLELALGENWRRGGTLLSSQLVEGELWATAVMAKDVEADARLRIGEVELAIEPRPYPLFGEE
ncbi:tRNA-modifying protein YgfZ [Ferrimonas sp. YFM]|uniref:CAF17-like 4Fe-4S cluster assembly/insertion protein YgfZ n=1 Tax=Ferrimonas sp. YFM TaxID=3028878 RepID=UPI002573D097|nr:tRNA-modifying protein YgfZ [Ferrimonas sp. YFM]BDY03445.1 tRNA-modifying protein YgfZ [Ferrimonas sp. YFM]